MSEAARLMIRFGFRDLKLKRLYARCLKENVASAKVLQNAGLTLVHEYKEKNPKFKKECNTLLFEKIK